MPSNSTLSTLVVSTPLRLAYGVPLILIAIPLLLAGTFLTLDRSRSFPPSHEDIPLPGALDNAKRKWRALFGLRGGVGGLASGYIFGRKSMRCSHSPYCNPLDPPQSNYPRFYPSGYLQYPLLSL